MAYVAGNIIAAADINGFINVLNTAWDVGNATRGYGQDINGGAINMPPVVVGGKITGADWSPFVSRLDDFGNHELGTPHVGIPVVANFNIGAIIQSHSTGAPAQDLPAAVTSADANRLLADMGSMTVFAGVTDTRTLAWGSAATPPSFLEHTVTADFVSADDARYFFNSGGEIRITGSRAGGTVSTHNTDWTNLLANMGTISFNYTQTVTSGTGTGSVIGYYDLTATYQTIFNTTGTGAYALNSYTVEARRIGAAGPNGSNGQQVQFLITFNDIYATLPDQVDGVLTSNVDFYKATTFLAIPQPTAASFTNSGILLDIQ